MENNIAFCGLYCNQCQKFKNNKCPGCAKNTKATWCQIRTCNINNNFKNCAFCTQPGPEKCKLFNNKIGKVFGLLFNSDRHACIKLIRKNGYEQYASIMELNKQMTIKRRGQKPLQI